MSLSVSEILLGLLLTLPLTISFIFWLSAAKDRFEVPLLFPRGVPHPPRSVGLFATGCALILLRMVIQQVAVLQMIGPPPETFQSDYTLMVARISVAIDFLMIAIALGIVRSLPSDMPGLIGFRRDDLSGQVRFGVMGFLAALLPVALCLLAIAPLKTPDNQHSMLKVLKEVSGVEPIVTVIVLATVTAPIVEELFYRVFMQQGLIVAGSPPRVVIPAVALFFCLNHTFPDMIPLFPLALLLGLIYHRRNSIIASIVMHMLFNAYNIVMMFAFPAE